MTAGIFNNIKLGAFSYNNAQATSTAGNYTFVEVNKCVREQGILILKVQK